MKTYDVKCPVCGKLNVGLDLEETDGWMECDRCGNVTQNLKTRKVLLIPITRADQVREIHQYNTRLAAAKGL